MKTTRARSAASSRPAKVEWSDGEKRAWHWPDRQSPSQWCETAPIHVPDNAINPEPGPYSYGRTPYLREIIDAAADPVIREIWFYKPTQVGGTRGLVANLTGYWIDQDPGALGILFPDEDTVEEYFDEELKPTIDASPMLKRHRSQRAWSNTKDEIWLDTMPVFGLYAGSVQKLARRSLRYIIGDEINKYRPFKNEASPIQLLKKRTSNWKHRARAVFLSTPTTREGNITVGYESCPDKREYFCRCPHCGKFELWIWSQVKGFKDAPGRTKEERANHVRLTQPAFYECVHCRQAIKTEIEKRSAVNTGVWVSGISENGKWTPTQTVGDDGKLIGERMDSQRVGFHLTSMVSPWLSFSDLAAEFIEAEGDIDKTRDFRNARLALPWDDVRRTTRPSIVRDKREISGPPLIVPKWAVAVYATFDTQKDWFAGAIRAWGWGFKSALIWHGQCYTFDEVYRLGLESRFEIEGSSDITAPKCLLIDSGGDRTDDVYQFAKKDPRIVATKGMSAPGKRLWFDTDVGNGVSLRMVDVHHFKGALWTLLHDPDQTKWLPHREVTEQYCLEMASEHLVFEKGKQVWRPTGSARNEAWDLEVMQRAAAEMDNIGTQQPPQATPPPQEQPDRVFGPPARRW